MSSEFITNFNAMAHQVFITASDHGFWDDPKPNQGEKIALMHGELSEALEAIRHGDPPDSHIPEFTGQEAELADAVIRIMDYAYKYELRVAEAIVAKNAYNVERPYKHGKTC